LTWDDLVADGDDAEHDGGYDSLDGINADERTQLPPASTHTTRSVARSKSLGVTVPQLGLEYSLTQTRTRTQTQTQTQHQKFWTSCSKIKTSSGKPFNRECPAAHICYDGACTHVIRTRAQWGKADGGDKGGQRRTSRLYMTLEICVILLS
jgi:hypothetical protein